LHDRFLSSRSRTRPGAALGRVFSVVMQTWALSDDPKKTKPADVALSTGRTASDAADLARDAAGAFRSYGFHKPSGAWWGSDGKEFHRFVVTADRRRLGVPLVLGLGLAALGLTALRALLRPRHD
jgi:hypothetical protein